ncbi:DUF6082 family protein [Streptomyces shaanxiensis]
MARQGIHRSLLSIGTWAAAAVTCVTVTGLASIAVSRWLIDGVQGVTGGREAALELSSLGDYFGGASAVFSGLALLMLVIALFFQQRELRSQREELTLQREELAASRAELRRSAEADLRALHIQLTQMAMADPTLASVWTTYRESPQATLRQHLYSNLVYAHLVLARSWDTYSDADVRAAARTMLSSDVFRHYWESTRDQKQRMSPQSPDGQAFQLFEQTLADLRRATPPHPS